jgi:PmbA protein
VTWNGELGDGFGARRFDTRQEFDARLERLAVLASALDREAAPVGGPCDTVLLHPRVVEAYVLDTLFTNLDGSAVAHGQSRFDRRLFGDSSAVLREDIELSVDPLQPLHLGAYAFSAEGVPAERTTFVERGRLVRPVLDLKYAKRLGLEPTAQPGAMDVVTFRGGAVVDLDRALGRAAGGVLVLSVLGTHTQDAVSGDFSLAAPQALRIGESGLEGRVRGTISGNLFDVLRQDDLTFVAFDGETTPGLLLRCRLDPS